MSLQGWNRYFLGIMAAVCIGWSSFAEEISAEALDKGLQQSGMFAYYTSSKELWIKFNFSRKNVRRSEIVDMGKTFTKAKVSLVKKGDDKVLAEAEVPLQDGRSNGQKIKTPDLDGEYELRFTFEGGGKTFSAKRSFERKHFAWEGNKLGITDEVYPPFETVKAEKEKVRVVQREYTMNGFGLWDSVISKGKELLAASMAIHYRLADGQEGVWNSKKLDLSESKPNLAVYRSEAVSDTVIIKTVSTIEMDGCMKVEMEMLPGVNPMEILQLWLEVPLRNKEISLFHEIADTIRVNYSGALPDGNGVVWDSSKSKRTGPWRNAWCSYVWLGAEERGLAWFAENDKGWATEKDGSQKSLLDIAREGDKVFLRVFFVNKPVILKESHRLVFGLQASPAKPMPENWRAKTINPGVPAISGPVNPWGGLHCGYKGPYNYDWQIVDKIIDAQKSGNLDKEWLTQYVKKHNPPLVYGTGDWKKNIEMWCKDAYKRRPVLTYAEGAVSFIQPEWQTFQDEWDMQEFTSRDWPDESVLRRGFNVGPEGPFPSCSSYRDYTAYINNEWLRRGVGLYWDNDGLKTSTDTHNSAAYMTEDGKVQPGVILWDWREYHKRTWNLLQYWRKHQDVPLEWSNHMTNALLLPIHVWGTATLDHELGGDKPFTPEWIRTETIGRHVGCYPHSLYELTGRGNPVMKAFVEEKSDAIRSAVPFRADWGMRMVHEVLRGPMWQTPISMLERIIRGFGYGQSEIVVHNYWEDKPILSVEPSDTVKWIALARQKDQGLLVVLSSWSEKDVTARIKIDLSKLGFAPGKTVTDPETGQTIAADADGKYPIVLQGPYGVRFLRFSSATAEPTGTLLKDDFGQDCDARWSNISPVLKVVTDESPNPEGNHVLRATELIGGGYAPRIEMWPKEKAAEDMAAGEFSFRFRLERNPDSNNKGQIPVLSVWWRAQRPKYSAQLGWTGTAFTEGCQAQISLDLSRSVWVVSAPELSKKNADVPETSDSSWHTVKIVFFGNNSAIFIDGQSVIEGSCDKPFASGAGISFRANPALIKAIDVDDVLYRKNP